MPGYHPSPHQVRRPWDYGAIVLLELSATRTPTLGSTCRRGSGRRGCAPKPRPSPPSPLSPEAAAALAGLLRAGGGALLPPAVRWQLVRGCRRGLGGGRSAARACGAHGILE
eukprot:scaffold112168_cov48-Phaeocystis_antarctica.AAC.1